jgi:hypothetical protein
MRKRAMKLIEKLVSSGEDFAKKAQQATGTIANLIAGFSRLDNEIDMEEAMIIIMNASHHLNMATIYAERLNDRRAQDQMDKFR